MFILAFGFSYYLSDQKEELLFKILKEWGIALVRVLVTWYIECVLVFILVKL